MGNSFDINKNVAMAHVRAEQLKGWFLANAKMLLIVLSGVQLFLGVSLIAWGSDPVIWNLTILQRIVGILPMALVGGLLAVVIEGATIFSSSMRKEVLRKMQQELSLLDKVKGKFNSEEVNSRRKKIEQQIYTPNSLMFVCVIFSITGAEIFWQNLFLGSEWYYHIMGFILGLVCSSLLIIFETHNELIERIIENSISSSGLVNIALDMSAKSIIHDRLFEERSKKLNTPEFGAILEKGAEQGLIGVVVEAIQMSGMTVSTSQLKRMIEDESESRQAAEVFLANGGQSQLSGPKTIALDKKRKSGKRKLVDAAVQKFGITRISNDLDKYAEDLDMDSRTLEKHLNTIRQEA
jgi:hypothetical protein